MMNPLSLFEHTNASDESMEAGTLAMSTLLAGKTLDKVVWVLTQDGRKSDSFGLMLGDYVLCFAGPFYIAPAGIALPCKPPEAG